MATTVYPSRYLLLNSSQTKQLSLVVQIEGVPYYLALGPLYRRIRYGDPDVNYGDPGLIYGGLKLRSDFKDYISLESALSIGQKIEPEQGRSAVSIMSIVLVDKDGFASQLMSPGILIPEVLGNPMVRVWLGYQ